MAAVTLDTLLVSFRHRLGGASVPSPNMRWALVHAARKFCRETKWLRETLVMDQVANEPSYTLTPVTAGTEVFGVKALQVRSSVVTPTSFEEAEQVFGEQIVNWIFTPPNVLVPSPVPTQDVTDGLWVNMLLMPALTAVSLPDALRSHWETIFTGAEAALYGMANAPWKNPADAADKAREFAMEWSRARAQADRQHRPYAFRTIPASW